MRTKLLLLFFALGEITASAQTDSLPNITKTSNGKLIDPIQIHEVVVTGTRNETDIRHLPMTISVIDRKQIEQSMQPSILPILTQQVPGSQPEVSWVTVYREVRPVACRYGE